MFLNYISISCLRLTVCVVLDDLQHKNSVCDKWFPHHPWWHRWWCWVESLPEGPVPHRAASWSAGDEPPCWAGPSEAPDAFSSASAPAGPSVEWTGEHKPDSIYKCGEFLRQMRSQPFILRGQRMSVPRLDIFLKHRHSYTDWQTQWTTQGDILSWLNTRLCIEMATLKSLSKI